MTKIFGQITIAIILVGSAFFFIRSPEYADLDLEGNTLRDNLFIEGEISPTEGIVENVKLIEFIKKEVSELRALVDKRSLDCKNNAKDFFSRPTSELLNQDYILKNIDFVFQNTLDRKVSEMMFVKLREVINADVTLKPGRIKNIVKSLEICRPSESLEYLHTVLDATRELPKPKKKKITYEMIKNFNLILLGDQHSFFNLDLIFKFLAQMEELGLIKGKKPNQMRDIKLAFQKDELAYMSHLSSLKNNKELIEYNKKYMGRLNQFSNHLKKSLKAFSKK